MMKLLKQIVLWMHLKTLLCDCGRVELAEFECSRDEVIEEGRWF